MARFEYLEARTVRQAISMLERHGEKARIVAGSTDFLVRWRLGAWEPDYVVNIQRVASLGRLTYSRRTGLRMGALTTIGALETSPIVRQHYPALAAAAAAFAGVQVRNLATVGGNICNASPAGDTLPALLAFEAECRIVGPGGERFMPLEQFFQGPGQTALQQSEILAEIRLPPTSANTGSLYIKHSPRGAMDIATVGVASVVTLQRGGRVCAEARIALGAVAPTPIRVHDAAALLRGQTITPDLIDAAAGKAQAAARPIDDVRGTAAHRKEIVRVLAQRTLERAEAAARQEPFPFELQRRLAVQAAF